MYRDFPVRGGAASVGDGRGWAFKATKTGKHTELVLTDASTRALRTHRARQRRLRLGLGPAYTDRKLIFASATGGPCNADVVGDRFRQIVGALALRLTGQTPPPPLSLAGQSVKVHREAKAARAIAVREAPAATGLDRLRLYDLRHSSASLGLAAGEDLKSVSERLGHSTITLTANVYSHVAVATKRRSAEARDALLAASR